MFIQAKKHLNISVTFYLVDSILCTDTDTHLLSDIVTKVTPFQPHQSSHIDKLRKIIAKEQIICKTVG